MPLGRLMPFRIARRARPAYPICSISKLLPDLSSKRITTCSPHTTGLIAIRRSTSFAATFTVNWPSCGIRCSSILRLDKILIRLTRAGSMDFGSCIISRSTPSTRTRILSVFSSGSICTSLARDLTAYSRIVLSARLIGESWTSVLISPSLALEASSCDASAAASTLERSVRYWSSTWRTPASEAINTFKGLWIRFDR